MKVYTHQSSQPALPSEETNIRNALSPSLLGISSSFQFFLAITPLNPCSFERFFNTAFNSRTTWSSSTSQYSLIQFLCFHTIITLLGFDTSFQHRHLTISLQSGLSNALYYDFSEQFPTLEIWPDTFWDAFFFIGLTKSIFCPHDLRGQYLPTLVSSVNICQQLHLLQITKSSIK